MCTSSRKLNKIHTAISMIRLPVCIVNKGRCNLFYWESTLDSVGREKKKVKRP
jgi:hypothetical protein